MQIEATFKSVSNKNYKFMVEPEQTFDDYLDKIEKPENHACKWIYKGKIMSGNTKFSSLNDEKPMIVFMFNKVKAEQTNLIQSTQPAQPTQPIQPIQPIQPTQPIQSTNQEKPNILQPDANMNELDKKLMSLMTSLVFIRSNPLLTLLFMNDIDKLFELLSTPGMKEAIGHVMDGDIQVKKIKPEEQTEKEDKTEKEEELSEQDEFNVKQLQEMSGKSYNECLQAYLLSNKDINNAAFMLI